MSAFNKFRSFSEAVAEAKHNLQSDTLKVLLTNVAPVNTNTQKSDLTEIGAGNGYSAGGNAAVQVSSAQVSGTYKLVLADVVFTASGGPMATFRYWVLYNDTSSGDLLIGWWDRGSGLTLADGESFTADMDPTTGVLTLA